MPQSLLTLLERRFCCVPEERLNPCHSLTQAAINGLGFGARSRLLWKFRREGKLFFVCRPEYALELHFVSIICDPQVLIFACARNF